MLRFSWCGGLVAAMMVSGALAHADEPVTNETITPVASPSPGAEPVAAMVQQATVTPVTNAAPAPASAEQMPSAAMATKTTAEPVAIPQPPLSPPVSPASDEPAPTSAAPPAGPITADAAPPAAGDPSPLLPATTAASAPAVPSSAQKPAKAAAVPAATPALAGSGIVTQHVVTPPAVAGAPVSAADTMLEAVPLAPVPAAAPVSAVQMAPVPGAPPSEPPAHPPVPLVDPVLAGDIALREGYSLVPSAALTEARLTGVPVLAAGDEGIGKVDALVTGPSGQIAQVVIGVGGFLALGDRDVAYPFDQVSFQHKADGSDLRGYVGTPAAEIKHLPAYQPVN